MFPHCDAVDELPTTHTSPTIDDLPNELILHILALLPLRALITTRGVSLRWRELVHAAPLCPLRRRYLALCIRAAAADLREPPDVSGPIAHPPSHASPWRDDANTTTLSSKDNTEDRQRHIEEDEAMRAEYLASLACMSVRVPREIELWVTEWPRRWWLDRNPISGLMWSGSMSGAVAGSWGGMTAPLVGSGDGNDIGALGISFAEPDPDSEDEDEGYGGSSEGEGSSDDASFSDYGPCGGVTYEPPAPPDAFPAPWALLTPLHGSSQWVKFATVTARGRLRDADGMVAGRKERKKGAGGSPLDDGTILHATRILPAELAWLCGGFADETSEMGESETQAEEDLDDEDDEGPDAEAWDISPGKVFEIMILCLREGRVYVIDGRHGGESLVGMVYNVSGSYTMHREKVLASSWIELLEKDLDAKCRLLGRDAS